MHIRGYYFIKLFEVATEFFLRRNMLSHTLVLFSVYLHIIDVIYPLNISYAYIYK